MTNGIPIDELIDTKANVYELTCVAISDAQILTRDGDKAVEDANGGEKVTCVVLEKVLSGEVEYTAPDDAE